MKAPSASEGIPGPKVWSQNRSQANQCRMATSCRKELLLARRQKPKPGQSMSNGIDLLQEARSRNSRFVPPNA
jgi:hypothetical protein